MFGEQVFDDKIDFRWTIQEEYEKLGLNKLVKLQEIKLAGDGCFGGSHSVVGIQLLFTEGISSPLFESLIKLAPVSHKIDLTKQITHITVGEQGSLLNKLMILDDNDTQLVKWELRSYANDKTQKLSANEAIIGLYGVKGKYNHISSLGFIVWDTTCFK